MIPRQKLAQRVEAENNMSRLVTREVGTRNIINYDQVYDPRSTHQSIGPFQPAKEAAEIAASSDVEPPRQGPAATPVPRDRLQKLLDPSGETQHYAHPEISTSSNLDPETQRHIEQVIGLEHHGNTIQRVSDKK